jgi:hypothetical protein
MNVKACLEAARAQIADFSNWTQGVHARGSDGSPRSLISPQACKWCADGALLKVCGSTDNGFYRETSRLLDNATHDLYRHSFVNVNDSERPEVSHAMILRAFDLAIANVNGDC